MRARKISPVSMMKILWIALFLNATHYFLIKKFFFILKSLKYFSEVLSFVKFAFVKIFRGKLLHNIPRQCIFKLGDCVLLFSCNVTEVLCCNSSPSHLCNRCGLYRLQIQNAVNHKKM